MKQLKTYFKVLLFVLVSIAFSVNGYSFVWHNGAGKGYGGGSGDGTNEHAIEIETYITKGAGYYLQADSEFHKVLVLVELMDSRGIDFKKMLTAVDRSLTNMQKALNSFNRMMVKAGNTPYNDAFTGKLMNFDYHRLMVAERLNKDIFDRVENFLKKGDINGLFKYSYSRLQRIHGMLKRVREELSMEILPEIAIFWDINEAFAETSLFGSYVAWVFSELQENKMKIKVKEKNNATFENLF